MGERQKMGVIGLYDRLPVAVADYEKLTLFSTDEVVNLRFDAAVASKAADGKVEIVVEHAGLTPHVGASATSAGAGVGLLVALVPGVGPAAVAAGLLVGGSVGEVAELRVDHERHKALVDAVDQAIDRGETVLCVVCAPDDAERFDQLMGDAQRVVQIPLDELKGPA